MSPPLQSLWRSRRSRRPGLLIMASESMRWTKDFHVWPIFTFDLLNKDLSLQRGRGDKLMMIASQTLLVSFYPVSKWPKFLRLHIINLLWCMRTFDRYWFHPLGCWWSTLAAGGLQDGLPQGTLEIVKWGQYVAQCEQFCLCLWVWSSFLFSLV